MDPITILGAVGTTLKIVKEVCEGLQWMQRVWESVTHGDKILQQISLECNIYGDSIKTIGQWLKKNKEATGLKRQMRTTQSAITLVEVSMANLLNDLKRFQQTGDKPTPKNQKMTKDKFNLKTFQAFIAAMAKQQWFRETMKLHLVELRAHTATLHLTLDVIRLVEHTPDHKAGTPEKSKEKKEETIQNETKKLERKVLMRQILIKALEIKRAEIAKQDESGAMTLQSSDAISSPGGLNQESPRKLTFYDVVLLARQQALAKKTQVPGEDITAELTETSLVSEPDSEAPENDVQNGNRDEDTLSVPRASDTVDAVTSLNDEPEPQRQDQEDKDAIGQASSPQLGPALPTELLRVNLLDLAGPSITEGPASLDLFGLVESQVSQEPASLGLLGLVDPHIPIESSNIVTSGVSEHQDDQNKAIGSDLIDFMDNQVFHEPSGLNILGIAQPESSRKPYIVDLLGFDDPQDTQELSRIGILDSFDRQATQAGTNQTSADDQSSTAAAPLHDSASPPAQPGTPKPSHESHTEVSSATLEPGLIEPSSASALAVNLTNQSPTALTDPDLSPQATLESADGRILQRHDTNDTFSDSGSITTATPSIFSQTSTLNSAASSVPGFTEGELQARRSVSSDVKSPTLPPDASSLAMETVIGLNRRSISKSILQGCDIETFESSPTEIVQTTHENLESHPKSQRRLSEDKSSQNPAQPELPDVNELDRQGSPWIVSAACNGDEELVQKLLVNGADIEASHATTGRDALSEAALNGHQKVVDVLIQENCPLDHYDVQGYTALHHACKEGYVSIARSLLSNGAPVEASGIEGQTALHLAMQVPHQNVVMLLIQQGAKVGARDKSNQTPLHIGASQGNLTMCNFLLNEGAQLDVRDSQSKTPLQVACEAGHYELIQVMLKHSNFDVTSMTFLAAFYAAVEHGHVRITESFFQYGLNLQQLRKHPYKPATLAAKSGSLDMIELMIQENCDINASNEKGWNALHVASYFGHYQIIDRLIENNVSAEASTLRKETPLLFAVKESHFAVVEKLLRSNKDGNLVTGEDEHREQPIHHVARTGQVDIFNLLMSCDTKINGENSFGWQPLHIATAYGHLSLVQRLIEQGANIEEKIGSPSVKKDQTHKIVEEGYCAEARWPYPGSCPLHLACEYGHYEIAKHLISKGAKLDAACSEGWQPLHHATYIGSSKLVELLLGAGVYPHAKTNEGKPALLLPFCEGGATISDFEKELIRRQLSEAMERVKKISKKGFNVNVKLKKASGSTIEDKHNLVRAATYSIDMVSKSAHGTKTTTRSPNPNLTNSQTSSLRRPQMPRLPHSSPLPQTRSPAISSPQPHTPTAPSASPASESMQHGSSTLQVSASKDAVDLADSHISIGLNLRRLDSATSETQAVDSVTEESSKVDDPSRVASAAINTNESHTSEAKTTEITTDQTSKVSIEDLQNADIGSTHLQLFEGSTEQAPEVSSASLQRTVPRKSEAKNADHINEQPSRANGETLSNPNTHEAKSKATNSTSEQPSKVSRKEVSSPNPALDKDVEQSLQTRPSAKRMMSRGLKKAKMGLDAFQRTETIASDVLTTIDDGIQDIQDIGEKHSQTRTSTDSKAPNSTNETENQISTEVAIRREKRKATLGLSRLKSGLDTLQRTETVASEMLTTVDDGIQNIHRQSSEMRRSIDSKAPSIAPSIEKQTSTEVAIKKEKRKTGLGLNRLRSGLETLQKTDNIASEVLTTIDNGVHDIQEPSSAVRSSMDMKATANITTTEKQISTEVATKETAEEGATEKDAHTKDITKKDPAKRGTTKKSTNKDPIKKDPTKKAATKKAATKTDGTKQDTTKQDATKGDPTKEDPAPKPKRKTTLGFNKLKSGLDTLQRTETLASEVLNIVSDGIPDQSSLVKSVTETTITGYASGTKPQASTHIKRKTLALNRVTTGLDKGMVGLGNIGKQTLEIGNKTLELSNKGLDLGIQSLELGKQGLDIVQGFEIANLGLGLKGARRFASKGGRRMGIGKGKARLVEGGEGVVGGVVAEGVDDAVGGEDGEGEGEDEDGKDGDEDDKDDDEDEDDDDDDDDDDDGSDAFSLGEFGDLGNDDF